MRFGRASVWVIALAGCGDAGSDPQPQATTTDAASSGAPTETSASSATSAAPTTDTTGVDPDATSEDPTSSPSPDTSAGPSDADGSSSSDTGTQTVPEGCFDYPSFVPTEVSFRDDVMPIFVQSCWMCHQDPAPEAGLFLGYGGTTDDEAVAVRNNLLTMTPHQAPNMTFVVPGDPSVSWLMAKMEYDDPGGDCPLIDCPNPGCDWFAPPTEILPVEQLDVFRSWIANGALDN